MKHFILILFFALANITFSQKVIIQDLISEKPIENVNVYNKKKTIIQTSNTKGEIYLSKFKLNELIYFSHQSYEIEKFTLSQIIEKNYIVKLVNEKVLKEIIINPLRDDIFEDFKSNRIEKITESEVQLSNPATTADMLQLNSGVSIQKSQAGGGSPVIRGFEANKILLVVDGVRMNNAIYRSGHLQNAVTIDNNILKSTDVFYGPGSVVYGSDALGGVIHFHTKSPILSENDSSIIKANAMVRYASASNEKTGHFDFSYGKKKWGSLTSVTYSDFGDLTMGKNRTHGYEGYGEVLQYVKTTNNIDSVMDNPNPNVHKRTGYSQIDLTQKFTYAFSKDIKIIGNLQYSTSSKINRFDNLNEYRNGVLRFAEWYYGPQNRLLSSVKFEIKKPKKYYDHLNLLLAYQRIEEDRISRKLYQTDRKTRKEDVEVYSFNADFSKSISDKQRLYYGGEFTHNNVLSIAFTENINTLVQSNEATRYPDGGSKVSSAAFYATYNQNITEEITLNLGSRYSHFFNTSKFIDNSFYSLPFDKIEFNSGSLIGSFGLTYKDKHGFTAEIVGSSGFRAPNVDDYGKVFETSGYVVVPNENLRAEYIYNGEISLAKNWTKNERETLEIKATGFYSLLDNAIIRRDFTLNGLDSLLYDGEMAKIQANQNVSNAYIYGAVLYSRINFTPYLSLKGSATYTYGRDITNNEPKAHIPPLFGNIALSYSASKFYIEASSMFNASKNLSDFATGTTDNPEQATINGTPAWTIFSFKSSYKLNKNLKVQFLVENILDTHYKQFSSGISGSGRNFILTLRGNF